MYMMADILGYLPVILKVAFGLGMVIFVHELGHFAVAKWCGVRCDKFYVGFDAPLGAMLDSLLNSFCKLFGAKTQIKFFERFIPSSLFKKQWGETEYGIGIVPPRRAASQPSSNAGKRSRSGGKKSSRCEVVQSMRRAGPLSRAG